MEIIPPEKRTPAIWWKFFGNRRFSSNPRFFGRTDLSISQSRAKFDEQADFDVRLAVSRPKPRQIGEKTNFWFEIFTEKSFFLKIADQKFRFSLIWRVFWRATAERTSKSACSSNFALDRLTERSVRPKNLGFGENLGSSKNFHQVESVRFPGGIK